MGVLVFLALFLSLSGHSSALYCICKDGGNDPTYQKTIDWACGNGADCRPIQQNGACFQPNTVKSHCDYAANSYYQNKGQTPDSCNFSNTATTSATLPSTVVAGCTYPQTAGQSTGIPSTTPGTSTGTGTGTTTGVPGSTTPGILTPTTPINGGIAPFGSTDPNYSGGPSLQLQYNTLFTVSIAIIFSCLLVLLG